MNIDIINEICKYLNDSDKIHLLSASKRYHLMKSKIIYNYCQCSTDRYNYCRCTYENTCRCDNIKKYTINTVDYNMIQHLSYYDSFTSIKLSNLRPNTEIILPNNLSHICIDYNIALVNIKPTPNKISCVTIQTNCDLFKYLKFIDFSRIKIIIIHRLTANNKKLIAHCINLEIIQILTSDDEIPFDLFYHNRFIHTILFRDNFDDITDQTDRYILQSNNLDENYYTEDNHFHNSQLDIFDPVFHEYDKHNYGKGWCSNIKTVVFSHLFNYGIERLVKSCESLEYLYFGRWFNRDLTGQLDYCHNLKYIEFGYYFNRPVQHIFDQCHKLQHVKFRGRGYR